MYKKLLIVKKVAPLNRRTLSKLLSEHTLSTKFYINSINVDPF